MTAATSTTSQPKTASLIKRMLAGAGIGLLLISLFLLSADEPNPEWGQFWKLRPLVVVPLAGAMGGLGNCFLVHFYYLGRVNKSIAIILSAIVYLVGLFLGFVLGLDGTMWD